MKSKVMLTIVVFTIMNVMFISQDAISQNKFGIRLGSYTDIDELYLGVDFLTPIGGRTYFTPNLEYVLIENGTYLTANADFHYDIHTRSKLYFWLGGGAGLAHFNPEGDGDNNSELAVNLLVGLGFNSGGSLIPYIQAKAILGDAEDFVLTFGLRF